MRKEQLVRICLAMLLASATLMLSSCKKNKDSKDKDPKEALVDTRWQETTDCLEFDPDDEIADVLYELRFTSQTEGELTIDAEGLKYTVPVYYSYDATQKTYSATITIENDPSHFIMKVNWDTNILLLYKQKDGVVMPKPFMFFTLVK